MYTFFLIKKKQTNKQDGFKQLESNLQISK